MIAFMFPGQGSQRRGMGQSLFDQVDEYARVEKSVDAILGYSLRRLCLEDAGNCLKETQFTQPALYVVNALHYYKAVSEGASPAYLLGHSVGEYNALLAAGVFDFLTGLQLVKRRGELMSQAKRGGMGAVIGLEASLIAALIKERGLRTIDVASFNSPSQTVIAGPVDDIKEAGKIFEERGARLFIPLQVSGAFHSRYMADAGLVLGQALAGVSFSAPKIPVVANVTSQLYPRDGAAEPAKRLLIDQMTHPVQWTESIRFLMGRGVTQFKEMGPGNVLTQLVQQIQLSKRQLAHSMAV